MKKITKIGALLLLVTFCMTMSLQIRANEKSENVLEFQAQGNDNDITRIGTVMEIVSLNPQMEVAVIKTEDGDVFRTKPILKGLLTAGQQVEIRTKNSSGVSSGQEEPLFIIILCTLGGPITFGICLTVSLVLLSSPAH